MRKYKVLCLTDHDKHSKENSIYAILSAMAKTERCEEIQVASRSSQLNTPFFDGHDFSRIFAVRVESEFDYESAKTDLHEKCHALDPNEFDILFLRLPRPVSDQFLMELEAAFPAQCFINKPSGIVVCSSKEVLVNFPEVCPPIKLCRSTKDVLDFASKFDLVLKPLREYGGKGIVRIQKGIVNDGQNNIDIQTYLKSIESTLAKEGVLAMKYLKNVKEGDKRLIVVGGEILAASLRLPSENSWLCNVAMGGTSVTSAPETEELEIIQRINPFLQEQGILIYGADTLVNDDGKRILSEINTLSIGGFPQAEKQTGKPIINITIDKIFSYADKHFG
jgi:glutathione synthase